jgi:RND family efflux transporter MFP subunit
MKFCPLQFAAQFIAGFMALHFVTEIALYAQGGGAPVPVKAAPIMQRKMAAGQAFVGTVTPSRRSTVGSAVSGRIVRFTHNEGDYVEEGEVLAQILTGTIEIELAQARAELKVREAELEESVKSFPAEKQQADAKLAATRARRDHAQSKLKRMQALRQRNNASEEAFDEAQAVALESEAAYLEAEAARKMIHDGAREQKLRRMEAQALAQKEAVNHIQDRLQKYTVKAYFSGYVTAEFTEVGHWIKDGDPVVEIAELDHVDIRVNVPEDHLADLEVGDAVRVEVNATRLKSFVGEVAAIVPQADLKARTFPVLVRLKNPLKEGRTTDGKPAAATHVLSSGMLARAILPVGRRKDSLLVSKDAIVLGGKAPIVFVIDRDGQNKGLGTVRIVPVELGAAVGGEIEVGSLLPDQPLKPGGLVVVEGNERLRPGQGVSFAEPATERTGD